MSGAKETVDVVIVGAGAAGALLAAKFAAAGKSVIILEAGPAWTLGDLVSSPIWNRRLHWGGGPVVTEGGNPLSFAFNAGWGLGGAALHHFAVWPRLKPEDFRLRTLYGRGMDWPIDYDELRPYYDRIQQEVGISGDAKAEVWRPAGAPYPMPPLMSSKQGDAIARGFAALGKRVAPAPLAINSVEYNGRAACIYDGWCYAGCPLGALANPQVTYLPQATEKGAVTIANATVRRVIATRPGWVDGVEYSDSSGAVITQPARLIVLAASTVGNPAILLKSVSELHPRGIGNANGLVGRYLMTHALLTIMGLFSEETEPHWGVSGALLFSHEDYGKTTTPGAFGSHQWLIGLALKPSDLARFAPVDLYGAKLDAFVRRATRHAGLMASMAEEMPDIENRVELKADVGGAAGHSPRIVHQFSRDALALVEQSRKDGIAVFKAAGATSISTTPVGSAHMMGGTVMGSDSKSSVTDSYGRVHGISNLVIAGPGLFPTSGAVNPTFTVHALALRTADHLLS